MKSKRNLGVVICELAAILLISTALFIWGKGMALTERGHEAIGGEYLLPLLPAIYYAGKRTILDWITDICKLWKGCNHG